jgi:hypothetical protein
MSVMERLADIPAKSSLDNSASANKEKSEARENEIRELVRRDVAVPRSATDSANNSADKSLNELIGRVSGASIQEIDRVISELQSVREMLRNEGARVNREISSYASLSHASMTAMKVIGDSVRKWKSVPHNPGSRSAA